PRSLKYNEMDEEMALLRKVRIRTSYFSCPHVTERQPGVAWQVLLDHISQEHLERGHSLANTRPDFNLMRYLYCEGIITPDQMRLLQVPAAPGRAGYIASQDTVRAIIGSSDEPCFSYANRQRERRMGRPKRNTA